VNHRPNIDRNIISLRTALWQLDCCIREVLNVAEITETAERPDFSKRHSWSIYRISDYFGGENTKSQGGAE
jgi:hypothetical protein